MRGREEGTPGITKKEYSFLRNIFPGRALSKTGRATKIDGARAASLTNLINTAARDYRIFIILMGPHPVRSVKRKEKTPSSALIVSYVILIFSRIRFIALPRPFLLRSNF